MAARRADRTAGATGQTGSNNTIFGNTGVGGQTFGGGAIVGVASKSKDPTIRLFNKKKTYDEWMFIYSPTMDLRQRIAARTLQRANPHRIASRHSRWSAEPDAIRAHPVSSPEGLRQQPGGFGQQNPVQNQTIAAGEPVSAGPEPAAIKQ